MPKNHTLLASVHTRSMRRRAAARRRRSQTDVGDNRASHRADKRRRHSLHTEALLERRHMDRGEVDIGVTQQDTVGTDTEVSACTAERAASAHVDIQHMDREIDGTQHVTQQDNAGTDTEVSACTAERAASAHVDMQHMDREIDGVCTACCTARYCFSNVHHNYQTVCMFGSVHGKERYAHDARMQ